MPDDPTEVETDDSRMISKNSIVISLLVIATISLVGISIHLWISGAGGVEVGGLLVDIAFSVFLIYLYLRMATTQETQQEILDHQTEIMRTQNKPLLEIGPVEVEEGIINVSLMNTGNGPIKDLKIATEIYVDNCEYEGRAGYSPLRKKIKQGPDNPDHPIPRLRMGSTLKPSERKRHFTGTPSMAFGHPDGARESGTFEEGLKVILDDCNQINFSYTIYIEGRDMFGDHIREEILEGSLTDIDTPLPFMEIYSRRGIHLRR